MSFSKANLGDRLRNEVCFNYFLQFKEVFSDFKAESDGNRLKLNAKFLQIIDAILPQVNDQYIDDTSFKFGDYFTRFIKLCDDKAKGLIEFYHDYELEYLNAEDEEQAKQTLAVMAIIESFVYLIYANDNNGLSLVYEKTKNIFDQIDALALEKTITKRISSGKTISKTTPQLKGSLFETGVDLLSRNYKPQAETSISCIKNYKFHQGADLPQELRFGTQGQRHRGNARISPLFESWLVMQRKKHIRSIVDNEACEKVYTWQQRQACYKKILTQENENPTITHVYINNLGLERSSIQGVNEKKLTKELHQLEDRHPNIAVITLPADKGIMDVSLMASKKTLSVIRAKEIIQTIATRNSKLSPDYSSKDGQQINDLNVDDVRDFHISEKLKQKLYGDDEQQVVKKLIDKSFKVLGFKESETITEAQLQAAMFHFTKFELTNHILINLNPQTFNASCKDAIDRGGVSSAYYNLIKSIELLSQGKTSCMMTRDEFLQGLHAAPTLVKGRGMNHHTKLIWNAIDVCVSNPENQATIEKVGLQWLVDWRDENIPRSRVNSTVTTELLQNNINKLRDKINVLQSGEKSYRVQRVCEIGEQAIVLTEEAKKLKQKGANDTNAKNIYRTVIYANGLAQDYLNGEDPPLIASRVTRFIKVAAKVEASQSYSNLFIKAVKSFLSSIAKGCGIEYTVRKSVTQASNCTTQFKQSVEADSMLNSSQPTAILVC